MAVSYRELQYYYSPSLLLRHVGLRPVETEPMIICSSFFHSFFQSFILVIDVVCLMHFFDLFLPGLYHLQLGPITQPYYSNIC